MSITLKLSISLQVSLTDSQCYNIDILTPKPITSKQFASFLFLKKKKNQIRHLTHTHAPK